MTSCPGQPEKLKNMPLGMYRCKYCGAMMMQVYCIQPTMKCEKREIYHTRNKMKFNLKDRVTIIDLDWKGIIIAIFIGNLGVQYQVRYFYNGDAKEVYFFEHELEKVEE